MSRKREREIEKKEELEEEKRRKEKGKRINRSGSGTYMYKSFPLQLLDANDSRKGRQAARRFNTLLE